MIKSIHLKKMINQLTTIKYSDNELLKRTDG